MKKPYFVGTVSVFEELQKAERKHDGSMGALVVLLPIAFVGDLISIPFIYFHNRKIKEEK